MFNRDFYPTSLPVIETMCKDLDLFDKVVFEPEAGKGNIVDYCVEMGAKVLACEINNDLAKIVSQKCQFLKPDVFDVRSEEISHINYVVMNPPFSADEKHILHLYEIMPEGCELVSLCNFETINNPFSTNRKRLVELIKNNGSSKKLGSMFEDAERKTKVVIGLIKLKKPKSAENSEFDGYFDMSEEYEKQENGLMQYSEVQNIVSRYVGAVKMWDKVQQSAIEINSLISPISSSLGIGFGAHWTDSDKNRFSKLDRDIFKKELQKSAWRSIFAKFNMNKYVTSGVMADINKFVEQQQSVPFTVKNIYKMLEMIVGTHAGRMDKVLLEAFDHICSLSHENSEAGEKWKTNSNYKVNQMFIDTYVCEWDKRWPSDKVKIRCGHSDNRLDDITKALCFLTGKNFDTVRKSLYYFFSESKTEWGQWVQWNEFFRVRGYKKGTMHFEFISEDVWMEFNRRVSKIKGWQIPQKTDSKKKGTERSKSKKVNVY